MTDTNDLDVGFDLEIKKVTRRPSGAGTWVCGTLSGHRFNALVFPEHADNPDWEIAIAASRSFGFSAWLTDRRFSIGIAERTSRQRRIDAGNCGFSGGRARRPHLPLSRNALWRVARRWFVGPDDGSHSIHILPEFDHVQEDQRRKQRRRPRPRRQPSRTRRSRKTARAGFGSFPEKEAPSRDRSLRRGKRSTPRQVISLPRLKRQRRRRRQGAEGKEAQCHRCGGPGLAVSKEPMNAKEMIEAMTTKALWTSSGGKTPHATLYSAIMREIALRGKEARFVKTERGKFAAK